MWVYNKGLINLEFGPYKKYLLWRHATRTSLRSVHTAWRHNKYFLVWTALSVNKSIIHQLWYNIVILISIKVVQIIKCIQLFWLITSKIFQLTHWYRYQFVGEVMADMWSIKEMIQCTRPLGFQKGWKNAISINIAFYLDFLIRN